MSIEDAKAHLNEAYLRIAGTAYRYDPLTDKTTVIEDFCTIAEELERVDRALGPPGSTMFAGLAQEVRAVFTELIAARKALEP